jgi:hypothetical protein
MYPSPRISNSPQRLVDRDNLPFALQTAETLVKRYKSSVKQRSERKQPKTNEFYQDVKLRQQSLVRESRQRHQYITQRSKEKFQIADEIKQAIMFDHSQKREIISLKKQD